MQAYVIGNYIFTALTIVDATLEAVNKARELFRAGAEQEARSLHKEALDLRRIELGCLGAKPVSRASSRSGSRFRRHRR